MDLFDRKEQSRVLSARPSDKIHFGLKYRRCDWTAVLSNTRFGEVTWQHTEDESKDQTFSAKILTDINVDYKLNDLATLGLAVNNMFDVFPDVIDTKGDTITDLGGRFKYPWEVNQFGFAGTRFTVNLKINL